MMSRSIYDIPPEKDILDVMRDIGVDRMQAIGHLRCRALLRQMPDRRFHDLPVTIECRNNALDGPSGTP